MKFNFKSLFQSNIVFILDPSGFVAPDNAVFAGLFEGEGGAGARFIDDPIIEAKFLNVPKQQIKIALEGPRLRVDDESKKEPSESRLVTESTRIFHKLFPNPKMLAYGFNFDFFYRFPNVIPAEFVFGSYVESGFLKKAKLKDLGIQFALEKENGKIQEVYFLKITGPTEIAVHYNWHMFAKELAKPERLQTQFEQAFKGADEFVSNLKF